MGRSLVVLCTALVVSESTASADVFNMPEGLKSVEMVTVGTPGNEPDDEVMVPDGTTGYGSVDYIYQIGKYEVTNAQYTEFLNAVADEDTYGLYNTLMWSDTYGCKIERTGSSPNYSYSVAADRANRPVNFVSWYDTLRFANWLHNGQPTGAQGASTTEDGAYDMSLGSSVVRKPGAKVWLPSENEWYKAAYYDPDKPGAPRYWDYPTQSDTFPTAESPPGTDMLDGSANYYAGSYVDPVYYTTKVGAYTAKPSASAYGTFDQGGNLWEWNEADITGSGSPRGWRGGSFSYPASYMRASGRAGTAPSNEYYRIGFRVAGVPEPSSLALLATAALVMLLFGRRRR
jgi:formylglycine-generating enzyme required for sulfatase activity